MDEKQAEQYLIEAFDCQEINLDVYFKNNMITAIIKAVSDAEKRVFNDVEMLIGYTSLKHRQDRLNELKKRYSSKIKADKLTKSFNKNCEKDVEYFRKVTEKK